MNLIVEVQINDTESKIINIFKNFLEMLTVFRPKTMWEQFYGSKWLIKYGILNGKIEYMVTQNNLSKVFLKFLKFKNVLPFFLKNCNIFMFFKNITFLPMFCVFLL